MNLYDLLDVDEDATTDEVRAAWKTATADLDPTNRQLRALNDAAAVLLDPTKRAAYDDELAAERDAVDAADADPVGAVDPSTAATVPADTPDDTSDDEAPILDDAAATTDRFSLGHTGDEPATSGPGAGPSIRALIVAGVAAVLSVALAIWVWTLPGARGDDSPQDLAERTTGQEAAALQAEAAAEAAVPTLMSYRYDRMDQDFAAMRPFVTDTMAATMQKGWPLLTKEAKATKTAAVAQYEASAVTRVSEDANRATVLVFFKQAVTHGKGQPGNLPAWMVLTMTKVSGSDNQWLVDDLCTQKDCG